MDKTLVMDLLGAIFIRFEDASVICTELFSIASAHDHNIHEFNIDGHGMHIGEPAP